MSSRLKDHFDRLAASRRKALVCYLTGGDPDQETCRDIAVAACKAGVDVLELGVPFSDPASDGPAIQMAALRALKQGATVKRILELARAIRAAVDTPIVLFGYFNPLLRYGLPRLCADAAAAGVDGLLVVDLPPEESGELEPHAAAHALDLIRLVAPTTSPERMRSIAARASGFLYLITRTGVTGSGQIDTQRIALHAAKLKSCTDLPVCLGFGISSPAEAAALAPLADGVVVGSAFVKRVAEGAGAREIGELAADFRRAVG
ncbi:MAG: tryptophan synthase subunit alpha [Kiritimatiellae bacterium]|nr:tryptophan synthase subunit alpha [Kiritimatiellia bacterium]